MNKKQYIILLFSITCFFGSTAKKAKELIELSELPKKSEQKELFSPQKIQVTKNQQQIVVPKETTAPVATKNESKKTGDYFKVPVVHKERSEQKDSTIKVTYLDDTKKEVQKKQPRHLEIANEITEDMITYHYLGARVPSKLSISFNDKPTMSLQNKQLKMPKEYSTLVVNEEDIVCVTLDYEFGFYRKGCKKVEYRIPPTLQQLKTTFDWKKPEKVIIEKAELIAIRDI